MNSAKKMRVPRSASPHPKNATGSSRTAPIAPPTSAKNVEDLAAWPVIGGVAGMGPACRDSACSSATFDAATSAASSTCTASGPAMAVTASSARVAEG